MNQINWDNFKCRCSGISKILSNKKGYEPITEKQLARITELEARTKPMTQAMILEHTELVMKRDRKNEIVLSDTCIEYLMEVFAWETQGMISVSKESLELAQTKKGKMGEREAGDLLCRVDKALYLEHKERISNDFLSGEIDLYLGEHVMAATNVTDIKNAFDYPTFLKKINTGLENGQREQVQGYGDITGAQELFIANCLVDCPDEIIEDMKWKLARRLNAITIESPDFLQEWAVWEKSMRFSHIPPHQRVFKIKVEPFTAFEKQNLYDRVKHCRDFLWKFEETYLKMNFN